MDETVKELRAMLLITDSSLACSLRPSDETQEQLERSSKRTRTVRKRAETLQDISYLLQKGHCEHQRNGFLQVRMAGMRKGNKKKVLKKKDGERNLHFPSCGPGVQAALSETRRTEWNKWMKFNAGVFLTDEEVRRLTEAGCEIYPMLFQQSTRVDWLIAEISRRQKDVAQILQLAMWIRIILFAVGVLRLTSPFTHANSRMDTLKDKKLIESCCIVIQLKVSQKKELQAEKRWPRVFPSTVRQTQGEDCGFD